VAIAVFCTLHDSVHRGREEDNMFAIFHRIRAHLKVEQIVVRVVVKWRKLDKINQVKLTFRNDNNVSLPLQSVQGRLSTGTIPGHRPPIKASEQPVS
jgi:hypothetical protein